MAEHSGHYWQASLENREGDLSRDVVLVYQLECPRTGLDLVASKHKGEDGYGLLTLTAGKELDQLRRQAAAQLGPAVDSQAASSVAATAPTETPASAAVPGANFTAPTPSPASVDSPPQANRGWDISVPTRGGGGAIDPVTALLPAGLAGLGFAARRKRQGRRNVL
jgi:hypothetical protein